MISHSSQNQATVSLPAIIALLLGATCSSMIIGYVGGGWKQGLAGYIAWVLMPYLVLIITHLVSSRFKMHRRVQLFQTWTTIVIALGGPILYVDAMFIHIDALNALVVLMVPVIQAAFGLFTILVSFIWQWRITRSVAKSVRQPDSVAVKSVITPGSRHRLKRLLRTASLSTLIITALLYALISMLQHSDAEIISTAKEVDAFIMHYCNSNGKLPTSGVLQLQFPDLNRDSGWFFFTNDKTYLKMQYPMKWWNNKAIGKPVISEFTATPAAYIVEYDCRNSK